MCVRTGHIMFALTVCAVFGVFLAVSAARVRALETGLMEAKDVVKIALEEVQARERQLQFTQTDEYVEREARKRYGFMKADELRFLPDGTVQYPEPIVLPRDRPTPPPEVPEDEAAQGEDGVADAEATEAPAP